MNWEKEMDEVTTTNATQNLQNLIHAIWGGDPEMFFEEFAKFAEERARVARDFHEGGDVEELYRGIAQSCREAAFAIYALEK